MQVCTSLQTDNHTSTPPLSFLQARCPSCHPTNSIKALKVVYPISRTRFCYFAKSDGLVNKAGSFDVTANNNTSKSHDNVYGAIIMTKVIGRVHPVHLMNVDWALGCRQPTDQANWLGLWVRLKLAATVHIRHRHCYYYNTHYTVQRKVEGWVDLGTAVEVRSPCPRLYITAAVAMNTTAPVWFEPGFSLTR